LQILSRKANEATALRAVDALRFLMITLDSRRYRRGALLISTCAARGQGVTAILERE
jgi:hypothetical protein